MRKVVAVVVGELEGARRWEGQGGVGDDKTLGAVVTM